MTHTPSGETMNIKQDAIKIAADISTRAEFTHVESPLILRIVEEVIATQQRESSSGDGEDATRWQPIETAPHNRKIIVSFVNEYGNRRQAFATFYAAGTLQADDSLDDDECDENGYAFPGWYEETETHESLMPIPQPTHYMLAEKPPIDAAMQKESAK